MVLTVWLGGNQRVNSSRTIWQALSSHPGPAGACVCIYMGASLLRYNSLPFCMAMGMSQPHLHAHARARVRLKLPVRSHVPLVVLTVGAEPWTPSSRISSRASVCTLSREAFNYREAFRSSTSSQLTDGFIVTSHIVQRTGSFDEARRRGAQRRGAYRGGRDLPGV